ncbi:hypothetical protein GQX74_005173 [Glossina fuscipes]|nr:hypothetical protein GQX74_005173 [Glossina fuscipes]
MNSKCSSPLTSSSWYVVSSTTIVSPPAPVLLITEVFCASGKISSASSCSVSTKCSPSSSPPIASSTAACNCFWNVSVVDICSISSSSFSDLKCIVTCSGGAELLGDLPKSSRARNSNDVIDISFSPDTLRLYLQRVTHSTGCSAGVKGRSLFAPISEMGEEFTSSSVSKIFSLKVYDVGGTTSKFTDISNGVISIHMNM